LGPRIDLRLFREDDDRSDKRRGSGKRPIGGGREMGALFLSGAAAGQITLALAQAKSQPSE